MTGKISSAVGASLIILTMISIFFFIASLISRALHLPPSLHLPIALRIVGTAAIGAGIGLILWLLKYRRPLTMLASTFFTFRKLFTGASPGEISGRTEPLIMEGPQEYVRHPLYLGAVLAFFGWGLLTGTTSTLIAALLILLWFLLVQIPFEEKEMQALFGDQYITYMHDTPMLVPFTKQKRR